MDMKLSVFSNCYTDYHKLYLFSGPPIPPYARETLTSQQHSRQNLADPLETLNMKVGESLELPSFMSDLDSNPDDAKDKMPPKVSFKNSFSIYHLVIHFKIYN